ncbi:AraC-like protein [Paenibacillus methanolicus]|uniref:AraC-like protein n=2 Tax=Paenibacillus methanolicus TaxID=582686 RepID=A0A5S5CD70_9BACL|nr:AraC-like protein [Paenibacillus methanolicus]
MDYVSFYRIPDDDDQGCSDTSWHLLLNSAGYYKFESYFRMTHRRRGRKDFYLSYNHDGPMTIYLKGEKRVLEPGSFFLYRPSEEQHYGHYLEQEFLAYWVHFTGYGAEELLYRTGLTENNALRIGASDPIASQFEAMMDELRDKKPGYELASASHLSYLFAMISRQLERSSHAGDGMIHSDIYTSLQYIHTHYAEDIYVKQLADLAHLSADRFTTLFKRMTAATPQQYILRFRLQRASELLKRTSLNIQQIASVTGFEDQLYFSRMFKKAYLQTPSEYRSRFDEGEGGDL